MSTEDVHLPGDAPAETTEAATLAAHVEGLGRRLLLLKALDARIAGEITETRRELQLGGFRPGNTMRPAMSDGKPAGAISYSVGSVGASVSDADAFARWAVDNYPRATSLEVKVAEWFTKQVLDATEAAGVPIGPGGEVGEDGPPGIRIGQRAGSISARPDPKRSAQLWAEMHAFLNELEAGNHE